MLVAGRGLARRRWREADSREMPDGYEKAYRKSLENPEAFWGGLAEDIRWFRKWDRVLDDSRKPFFRWFPGALVNTCHNALDRHVEEGRAEQLALVYDSPVTERVEKHTYRELRDAVARFAGALTAQGIAKG